MAERSKRAENTGPKPHQGRLMAARLRLAVSIAAVVPLGFAMKFYSGPAEAWVNNSLGGTAYVIFFCLLFALVWPARRAIPAIVISVFVVTCGLEALQLWHPPLLQAVRRTFIGRTLIGTTFTWSDYIYYVLGAALGWLWLHFVCLRR